MTKWPHCGGCSLRAIQWPLQTSDWRTESDPDPAQATRRMPTAERVARQQEQEKRLGGLIFNPNPQLPIPSNHLVDMFVEMCETGILTYVKAEHCCSRAQEVESIKKDTSISTDPSGLLKLSTKQGDQSCDAGSELKLRGAWQRRSLAMDLAGIASFETMETWAQFLFQQLLRDQPKGFAKISLQQLVDCDRNLFILASHLTMGKLTSPAGEEKPLDQAVKKLKDSTEVLQYLAPLPVQRAHESPAQPATRPNKVQKVEKGGPKAKERAHKEKVAALTSCNCQKGAPPMTQRTDLCVSPSKMGVASLRAHRENGAPEDTTSATSRTAFGRSRTIYAIMLTELWMNRFHMCKGPQHHFLLNFLLAEGRFHVQRCRQVFQF